MNDRTRLAKLLRSYGVGTRMSVRKAATVTGVSRQTLINIMNAKPGDSANMRQRRQASLRKIAAGLDIPFELIEREAMADWGLIKTVSDETVQGVLGQLQALAPEHLAMLQSEIGRLQLEYATGRRTPGEQPGDAEATNGTDDDGSTGEQQVSEE